MRVAVATLATGLVLAATSAVASATPPACPEAKPVHTILSGQGQLESVLVDPGGRLFYTDTTRKALMRLDRPGARPVQVAGNINAGGGLAMMDDDEMLVGYGDGINGLLGTIAPTAGLLSINVRTGARKIYVTGLEMANGVVRAADGTVFASADFGVGIDRVDRLTRAVTHRWALVPTGNGMAIDSTGRYLFVNQTFLPAAIARVEIASPSHVTTYVTAAPLDAPAGLDGMTIDGGNRLFVAANQSGQVWRVDTDKRICTLATGLGHPSAVTFGLGALGSGFPATSLYAVTFGGSIVELPGARPPARSGLIPRPSARPGLMHLTVSPRRVRAGSRVRLRARVTGRPARGRRPVALARALVSVGGKRVRTGRDGRATVLVRFTRAGLHRATVVRRGYAPAGATIRVLARRHR